VIRVATHDSDNSAVVNTNAAGYELSAIVAEGNGQAVPLGFIFTTSTNSTSAPGAKKRLLTDFLLYFCQKCPYVKFTLTDKEKCEVDACRTVFTDAKHSCCYYHAVEYVENWPAEDKAPGPYNPRVLGRVFSFPD
jgi:hypothetical protein